VKPSVDVERDPEMTVVFVWCTAWIGRSTIAPMMLVMTQSISQLPTRAP
jgi:hypothetical protein